MKERPNMDKTIYDTFMTYLAAEDKASSVRYAIGLVEDKTITLESLYLELLAPSLSRFECPFEDEALCIWKEHIRTSIVRIIIEASYVPLTKRLEGVKRLGVSVMVTTPAFEYHEIGAILNTHLMLLEGFDATYIGANTPKDEILSALRTYDPDYLALSVTNQYNLVITKQITEEIRRYFPKTGIILGGFAFANPHNASSIPHDKVLQSLSDLKAFANEVSR
jgi:MerR family transcriptional regulator, light-induced transcriptional regulator